VRRKTSETSKLSRRFKVLMTRLAPFAVAFGAAFIFWHAARDTPGSAVATPAPLIHPGAASSAVPPPGIAPAIVQQASVAATIEVIVARNDTLDSIFSRMALDKADLAAIRNLPGVRQSLDFLKPGDAVKLTHTDGEIRELSRKVSETQTLKVVRDNAGFEATMISDPVETRIRTATATIDSSLFQAAETANISDSVALKLANAFA